MVDKFNTCAHKLCVMSYNYLTKKVSDVAKLLFRHYEIIDHLC